MNTFFLSLLTVTNIATIFVFQWSIAVIIGPGGETDAFFVGFLIPQMVNSIVLGSIINVLMPIFSQTVHPENFIPTIIARLLKITLPVCIVFIAGADLLVSIAFTGFSDSTAQLATSLLRIQCWAVPFMIVNGVFYAYHYSIRKNVYVEVTTLFGNLICLFYLFWRLPSDGINAAAIAVIIRYALPSVILFPRKLNWLNCNGGNQDFLKLFWSKLKPILLSSTYYKSDILVDRVLSSMAAPGMMTLFNLSHQINVSGTLVFNKAINNPMVVNLSDLVKQKNKNGYWRKLRLYSLFALGLYSVWFIILILFGEHLLSAAFEFKNFTAENVRHLYILILLLGGVLLGGMLGQVLAANFYVLGQTGTLARIGIVGFTIGIILKIGGFLFSGIYGLAIMTSFYYLLNCTMMIFVIMRQAKIKKLLQE